MQEAIRFILMVFIVNFVVAVAVAVAVLVLIIVIMMMVVIFKIYVLNQQTQLR